MIDITSNIFRIDVFACLNVFDSGKVYLLRNETAMVAEHVSDLLKNTAHKSHLFRISDCTGCAACFDSLKEPVHKNH